MQGHTESVSSGAKTWTERGVQSASGQSCAASSVGVVVFG